MFHHLGRKLKHTGKRLLKTSRKAGRGLAKGTGFVKKVIGKLDDFSGGLATKSLMKSPYGKAGLATLESTDKLANKLQNPLTHIKDRSTQAIQNGKR